MTNPHFANRNGRVARWRLYLSQFNLVVQYVPGSTHLVADGLSRTPFVTAPKLVTFNAIAIDAQDRQIMLSLYDPSTSATQMAIDQKEDRLVCRYRKFVKHDPNFDATLSDEERVHLSHITQSMTIMDGVLIRLFEPSGHYAARDLIRQVVLPEKHHIAVLKLAHVSAGGHLGIGKTYLRVRDSFYWEHCFSDVQAFVMHCLVCARFRLPPSNQRIGYHPMLVTERNQRVGLDISGPHIETARGNRYYVLLVDYFTKFVEAFPTRDQEASTIANIVLYEYVLRYGPMQQLVTDRGANLIETIAQSVYTMLGIDKRTSSAHYAQTDGMSERSIKTLGSIVKKVVLDSGKEWDLVLSLACYILRITLHHSTGATPYELTYHQKPVLPEQLQLYVPADDDYSPAAQFQRRWKEISSRVHQSLQEAADVNSKYVMQSATPTEFKVGDLVLVKAFSDSKDLPPMMGPYRVVEVLSLNRLRLGQLDEGPSLRIHPVVNYQLCRRYVPSNDNNQGQKKPKDESSLPSSSSSTANEQQQSNEQYVVHSIIRHKLAKGIKYFLVQWQGQQGQLLEQTWEPEESFVDEDGTVNDKFLLYCRRRHIPIKYK
jgi:hypothetical protein